jgi:predicted NBD/HSP70 family sugar kinase
MVRQPRVLGQRPQRHRGASAEELRRHNLSLLVDHIHVSGSASRSQLATLTGLNRSTIADLVAELVDLGLVVERPTTVATGPGRPSRVVAAQPAGAVVVAVELAVDSIAVATVGLSGHVFNRVRVDRERGRFSPAETLDDVASLAEPLLGALPDPHRLTGVGVAVVGITRTSDGFVHFAPNLGWRDVPLGELMSARLGFGAPVSVANEADLGALSEHRRGADAGVANLLFVSGEVGIGLGVILGGERRLGAAGYAGEAGHMLVNPAGVRCRCGAVGCWETEAGEEALLRAALTNVDGGSGQARVDSVLAGAAAGDKAMLDACTRIGRWLGLGIGDLVNLFNPDLVVLGGLFSRLHPIVEDTISDGMSERVLDAPGAIVKVATASLGIDAPLLGAAELAFSDLIGDPSEAASFHQHQPMRSGR